jgi:hypothetical protein
MSYVARRAPKAFATACRSSRRDDKVNGGWRGRNGGWRGRKEEKGRGEERRGGEGRGAEDPEGKESGGEERI